MYLALHISRGVRIRNLRLQPRAFPSAYRQGKCLYATVGYSRGLFPAAYSRGLSFSSCLQLVKLLLQGPIACLEKGGVATKFLGRLQAAINNQLGLILALFSGLQAANISHLFAYISHLFGPPIASFEMYPLQNIQLPIAAHLCPDLYAAYRPFKKDMHRCFLYWPIGCLRKVVFKYKLWPIGC